MVHYFVRDDSAWIKSRLYTAGIKKADFLFILHAEV